MQESIEDPIYCTKSFSPPSEHTLSLNSSSNKQKIVDVTFLCSNFNSSEVMYEDLSLLSLLLLDSDGSCYVLGPIFLSGFKIRKIQLEIIEKRLEVVNNGEIHKYFEDWKNSMEFYHDHSTFIIQFRNAQALNYRYCTNKPQKMTVYNHTPTKSASEFPYVKIEHVYSIGTRKLIFLVQKNLNIKVLWTDLPVYGFPDPAKDTDLLAHEKFPDNINIWFNLIEFNMLNDKCTEKMDHTRYLDKDSFGNKVYCVKNELTVNGNKLYAVIDDNVVTLDLAWVDGFMDVVKTNSYTGEQIKRAFDELIDEHYCIPVRNYFKEDNKNIRNWINLIVIGDEQGLLLTNEDSLPTTRILSFKKQLLQKNLQNSIPKPNQPNTNSAHAKWELSTDPDLRVATLKSKLAEPVINMEAIFSENKTKIDRWLDDYNSEKETVQTNLKTDIVRCVNGYKYINWSIVMIQDCVTKSKEYQQNYYSKLAQITKKNVISDS